MYVQSSSKTEIYPIQQHVLPQVSPIKMNGKYKEPPIHFSEACAGKPPTGLLTDSIFNNCTRLSELLGEISCGPAQVQPKSMHKETASLQHKKGSKANFSTTHWGPGFPSSWVAAKTAGDMPKMAQ